MRRGLAAIAFLFLLYEPGIAHEMRPAYLELKQTGEETYSLLFKVPARGPNQRLLALQKRINEFRDVIVAVSGDHDRRVPDRDAAPSSFVRVNIPRHT